MKPTWTSRRTDKLTAERRGGHIAQICVEQVGKMSKVISGLLVLG